MFRGDLTDEEWAIIGVLLPPERGRWARPAGDNRLFLNGMLDVLRTGCPWRDMHERYGKWNSVCVRFRRWAEQGVGDALLQTLVDIGLTDNWQHMIDSTIVRHPAPTARQRRGRGRGGFGHRRHEIGDRRQSNDSLMATCSTFTHVAASGPAEPSQPVIYRARAAASRTRVMRSCPKYMSPLPT